MAQAELVESGSKRLGFAVTLSITMASGTFLSFSLGALAPFLVRDLDITAGKLGVAATAFLTTGALASPVIGRAANAFPPRPVSVALLWSVVVSLLIITISDNYTILVACALVAGLFGAAANPVTNALVGLHLMPGDRGVVVGAKQAGVQVGMFLAGATLPSLAVLVGWRGSMLAACVVPLFGLVGVRFFVPRARAGIQGWSSSAKVLSVLRQYRVTVWMSAYGGFMGCGTSAVGVFLPLYNYENVAMSPTLAGLTASLLGLVGIPARVVWGGVSERSGVPVHLVFGLLGLVSAAGVVGILLAEYLGAGYVVAGVVVLGLAVVGWNVWAMLFVVNHLPSKVSGSATGVLMFTFYLGLAAGPGLFAWLVSTTGLYASGWLVVTGMFVCASLIALVWGRRVK